MVGSYVKHVENPDYKLLPTIPKMVESVIELATKEDKRTGDILLWVDSYASLRRLTLSLGVSTICGLLFGLNMGLFPGFKSTFLPLITFKNIVPPAALIPIIFVVAGTSEFGKGVLVFIGTFPTIARNICFAVEQIPKEQIVKSLTLGATQLGIAYRIVLPQVIPTLIHNIRICVGPTWWFVLTAEMLVSREGLGHRIFLMQRTSSMEIIIPYALWITFLGFVIDVSLRTLVERRYRWSTISE
jgi:NitT/TauT family transport system permease protein